MSKVSAIIINVPEMQAKGRWSEWKWQVQTEIFLQRPIGLKGSSDKASKCLCQDLYCGEN